MQSLGVHIARPQHAEMTVPHNQMLRYLLRPCFRHADRAVVGCRQAVGHQRAEAGAPFACNHAKRQTAGPARPFAQQSPERFFAHHPSAQVPLPQVPSTQCTRGMAARQRRAQHQDPAALRQTALFSQVAQQQAAEAVSNQVYRPRLQLPDLRMQPQCAACKGVPRGIAKKAHVITGAPQRSCQRKKLQTIHPQAMYENNRFPVHKGSIAKLLMVNESNEAIPTSMEKNGNDNVFLERRSFCIPLTHIDYLDQDDGLLWIRKASISSSSDYRLG